VWPRNVSEPRFSGLMRGVALAFVAAFAVSSVLAKNHYTAYAADAPFSTAGLLMEDAQIPEDVAVAKREVETWGKERPRDPRVHLFRALRLLDEGNPSIAESELRAALAEKQILEGAFGNHKLEGALRSVLAELLVQQGRNDEAKREAAPACQFEAGPATDTLRTLGLCP
jgi:rhomboid protease GluP